MSGIDAYERSYFYHRAQRQIALAQAADHEAAVAAHITMADHYLDLSDVDLIVETARRAHNGLTPYPS